MAGELDLKSLLSLDITKFKAGVTSAMSGVDRMGAKFKATGAVIGGVGRKMFMFGSLAAGVLGAIIKKTANWGDKIQKLAIQTGETTEFLSEMTHAAEISGTSLESLAKGFKRLSMGMYEASQDVATYKEAFDALGVKVVEGNGKLRSMEDALPEIADAFMRLGDDTKAAALAQEIFGRAGVEMLPLLKSGSAGIAELRKEARKLGLSMSQEAADKSAEFNDALTNVKNAMKGVTHVVVTELLPALIPLINKIAHEWIPAITKWVQENKEMAGSLAKFIVLFTAIAPPLGLMLMILSKIFAVIGVILPLLKMGGILIAKVASGSIAATGGAFLPLLAVIVASVIAIRQIIKAYRLWNETSKIRADIARQETELEKMRLEIGAKTEEEQYKNAENASLRRLKAMQEAWNSAKAEAEAAGHALKYEAWKIKYLTEHDVLLREAKLRSIDAVKSGKLGADKAMLESEKNLNTSGFQAVQIGLTGRWKASMDNFDKTVALNTKRGKSFENMQQFVMQKTTETAKTAIEKERETANKIIDVMQSLSNKKAKLLSLEDKKEFIAQGMRNIEAVMSGAGDRMVSKAEFDANRIARAFALAGSPPGHRVIEMLKVGIPKITDFWREGMGHGLKVLKDSVSGTMNEIQQGMTALTMQPALAGALASGIAGKPSTTVNIGDIDAHQAISVGEAPDKETILRETMLSIEKSLRARMM